MNLFAMLVGYIIIIALILTFFGGAKKVSGFDNDEE